MKRLFILLLIFFCTSKAFAFVKARTDQVSITENEVFQLEIQTDADISMPDLSPLQNDFDIVGHGSSQSYHFDGKNHISQNSLILNLMPKRTGLLTIPELIFGKEKTEVLQIEVKPNSDTLQMQNENAVIIEAEPLTKTTYQGAGLIYRVKVFERIGLVNAAFQPPFLAEAQIITLGSYSLSQEKKDGSLYQVLTQDYMIFPEKSGDNLTIEPASFQGYYLKKPSAEQLLPFGFADSFIYQPRSSIQKEFSVKAKPVQITVLPQPENTKNHWWLPSTNVHLSEAWNLEQKNFKVGEPITRQITLNAVGTLGRMLPDLSFTNTNDFKVYPEEAQKKERIDENDNLIGTEVQSFAFIPLHAGQITLPSLSVSWFDVNDGQMKKAILPAKTFTVAPNPQYANSAKSQELPKEEKSSDILPEKKPFEHENSLLYFMGGLCLGLGFSVIGIILFHQKRSHKKKLPELYPHEK